MRTASKPQNSRLSLEDLTLHEATCSECGRPISSIPAWLASATVKFQCEECRQKHPRIPGMAEIEPRRTVVAEVDELGETAEVVEEPEEEADEDREEASGEYAQ